LPARSCSRLGGARVRQPDLAPPSSRLRNTTASLRSSSRAASTRVTLPSRARSRSCSKRLVVYAHLLGLAVLKRRSAPGIVVEPLFPLGARRDRRGLRRWSASPRARRPMQPAQEAPTSAPSTRSITTVSRPITCTSTFRCRKDAATSKPMKLAPKATACPVFVVAATSAPAVGRGARISERGQIGTRDAEPYRCGTGVDMPSRRAVSVKTRAAATWAKTTTSLRSGMTRSLPRGIVRQSTDERCSRSHTGLTWTANKGAIRCMLETS
jgi:hypothetical protein